MSQLALANEWETCEWCGGEAVKGSTCPKSVACPRCGANAGARCLRPSGHRTKTMHAARYELAEGVDLARGLLL